MCSFADDRLAIPSERWSALGLDWYAELSGGRNESPLVELLRGVNHKDSVLLSGNALHIPIFTVWVFFVLAHCEWQTDSVRVDDASSESAD